MDRAVMGWLGLWTMCAVVVLSTAQVLMSDEKTLVKNLTDNYDKIGIEGRPVLNASEPIHVNISFSLLQILEFDQENQVLTIVGWQAMEWMDSLCTWNPEDFAGVTSAVLDPDSIWTPDVVLFNSVEPPKYIHDTRLLVGWQGNVTWVQESRFRLNCKTNPDEDSPTCELRFGSWAYDESRLRLKSPSDRIDAKFYVPHHIWELSKNKALQSKISYPYHPDVQFDDVTFEFELRRRPQEKDPNEDLDSGALSTLCQAQAGLISMVALFTMILGDTFIGVR